MKALTSREILTFRTNKGVPFVTPVTRKMIYIYIKNTIYTPNVKIEYMFAIYRENCKIGGTGVTTALQKGFWVLHMRLHRWYKVLRI